MSNNIDILTASEVLARGLLFVGFERVTQQDMTHKRLLEEFRAHYGGLPIDFSQMWYDLQTTTVPGVALTENEKKFDSFKMFMAANYFLWSHPKNARILASRFKLNVRQIHSDKFWKWIYKMSALTEHKVKWDPRFGDDNYAMFIVSVDGVDFDVWEKPSERYNIDKGLMSHKSRHGALRYLIALSLWESKCVFIDGPARAGDIPDIALFRQNLKQKMLELPGKILIADGGLGSSENDEMGMVSIPNPSDPHKLHQFKARARQRHESFNGRLKQFKILQDTFRFPLEKHQHVLKAVCVRVGYAMESGSPLFDVV